MCISNSETQCIQKTANAIKIGLESQRRTVSVPTMSSPTTNDETSIACPGKLLNLPAEIRIAILEHVFNDSTLCDGFTNQKLPGGILVDETYSVNTYLQPLFTCQQMYRDGHLLALNRTSFICSNLFFDIPSRISLLHIKQVEAIRSIAFVADSRHFRKILEWGAHPFGLSNLNLTTLTIVLHRSSFWHYLFDFTADIVKLLRCLNGVQRLVFVRNGARVKGSFKTWYNRLVGLIMKIDHHERYERTPASPENTWWKWSYDEMAQSFCLEACEAKQWVGEEMYMQQIAPLMEELRVSVENEEWNPDPRSRNHYY